jgi:SSS family solute:Na+ symporter
MPFRKKPLSTAAHLRLLRLSILGVAIFGFLFSLYFNQSQRILMFFQMTGAIWAGAGGCIVGGLYWKKGTTGGAWTSMLVGATLGLGGTLLMQENYWHGFVNGIRSVIPAWGDYLSQFRTFPIDGNKVNFGSCILALLSYVVVSLVQTTFRKQVYNLEKLLHRGKYRITSEHERGKDSAETATGWRVILPGPEFTRGDKAIYFATLGIALFWFSFFVVVTLMNLLGRPFSDAWWLGYWKFRVVYSFLFVMIVTIWFSIGGILELPKLFRLLRDKRVDDLDDGRVVDPMNLEDSGPETPPPAP